MANPSTHARHDPIAAVLYGGLALGLIAGLVLAWLPLPVTLSHFVFEDSFYYLRVARSIINGNGSTFDGIHPTNGFHPLWMLVSILVSLPFEAGSPVPIHLLLSLCAGLHASTAYLMYRAIGLAGDRTVAVVVALLWLFNYNIAGIALCGLETSLVAFLLILTLRYYLCCRQNLGMAQGWKAGLLVGLTTLARFDGALLGFFLAADQAVLAFTQRERPRRALARIVPMSAAGSAAMIPWMVWSWNVSGSILPNSHRALRLWIGPETRLQEDALAGLVQMFARYAPDMARVYGFFPLSWPALAAAVVFVCILVSGRTKALGLPLFVFVVYPVAHSLYYAFSFAPLNRYLYPAHLVVFAAIGLAAGGMSVSNRSRAAVRAFGGALLALVLLNVVWSGAMSWKEGKAAAGTHSLHWTMYSQAVPWLRKNVQPDEKIGAFNCGIYGYFSGRTVVNLDGVINDSVIPYLEQGRLVGYLREEGITYVVDWETALAAAFTRFGGVADYRERFRFVHQFEQPWGPHAGARLLVLQLE